MVGLIDVDRALIRGEYIKALSQIERRGIPIDKKIFMNLKENWGGIQDLLIKEIDQDFNVFEGKTFKRERFEEYLNSEGISWPRLDTGIIDLKDETFRAMSKKHPKISPLRSSVIVCPKCAERISCWFRWKIEDYALLSAQSR